MSTATLEKKSSRAEAEAWIKQNRCPDCARRFECAHKYQLSETYRGWRCHGYMSRYYDDRNWA